MADQEKKGGADQIRVVEDSPEEVIRLDSPKRIKLEKRGALVAEKIEVMRRDEEEMTPEKEVRPFDPEEGWTDGGEDDERKSVPMGWFYLLGAGLLGVLCWVGFQNISSSRDVEKADAISGRNTGSIEEGLPLGKVANEQADKDAELSFANTERVVAGFLNAATIDEKLKFVRHPERMRPLMESYYSRHELEPISFKQISMSRIFPLENRPFLALTAMDTGGESHPLLLEDRENGVLVDWESFVCFQPVELADYMRDRSSESTVLRAYVTPDYYHSSDFESRDEYASFRLSFRGSDLRLNGYVKRGGELYEKFRKLYPPQENQKVHPLIVTVRFLEGGKSPRSVLIEELNSKIWAFAKNPAEVASSEK